MGGISQEQQETDESEIPKTICFIVSRTLTNESDNNVAILQVSKIETVSCTMKMWETGVENLTLVDQIQLASLMARHFEILQYRRKKAFALRQVALLLIPHVMDGKEKISNGDRTNFKTSADGKKLSSPSRMSVVLPENESNIINWTPSFILAKEAKLTCMKTALQGYSFIFPDLKSNIKKKTPIIEKIPEKLFQIGVDGNHGWPILQLDVLKEAIAICEMMCDYVNEGELVAILLYRLSTQWTKSSFIIEEQTRLMAALKRITMKLSLLTNARGQFGRKSLDTDRALENNVIHEPLKMNGALMSILRKEDVFSETDCRRFSGSSNETAIEDKSARLWRGFLSGLALISHVHISKIRPVDDPLGYPNVIKVVPKPQDVKAENDIFIFDPFAAQKKAAPSTISNAKESSWILDKIDIDAQISDEIPPLLVDNEPAYCNIILRNPFMIPLEIQSISLVVNSSSKTTIQSNERGLNTLIPPGAKNHIVTLRFFPKLNGPVGDIAIEGCLVRFSHGWTEYARLGKYGKASPLLDLSLNSVDYSRYPINENSCFKLSVISAQPLLKIIRMTNMIRSHNVFLLEGETSYVSLRVRNIGPVTINHLRMSCRDITCGTLDGVGEEGYEEHLMNHIPSFWWESESDRKLGSLDTQILPLEPGMNYLRLGEEADVTVGVYGKANCTGAVISLEYGSEKPNAEKLIYLRTVRLDVSLTVQRVIEAAHMEILPFWYDQTSESNSQLSTEELFLVAPDSPTLKHMCLFVLDLKSNWNSPVVLRFNTNSNDSENADPRNFPKISHAISPGTLTVTLFPQQTKRIAIPIERLDLDDFFRTLMTKSSGTFDMIIPDIPDDMITDIPPIPVHPSKQFVVSKTASILHHYTLVQSKLSKMLKKEKEERRNGITNDSSSKFGWGGGVDGYEGYNHKIEKSEKRSFEFQPYKSILSSSLDSDPIVPASVSDINTLEQAWFIALEAQSIERWRRILFYFKDQLFRRRLHCIQFETGEGTSFHRQGELIHHIRSRMRLSKQMVSHLRKSDTEPSIEVKAFDLNGNPMTLNQINHSKWVIEFSTQVQFSVVFKASSTSPDYVIRAQIIRDQSESDGFISYKHHPSLLSIGTNVGVVRASESWALEGIVCSSGTYKVIWMTEVDDHLIMWCCEPIILEFNRIK